MELSLPGKRTRRHRRLSYHLRWCYAHRRRARRRRRTLRLREPLCPSGLVDLPRRWRTREGLPVRLPLLALRFAWQPPLDRLRPRRERQRGYADRFFHVVPRPAQAARHHAAERGDAQLARAVARHVEICRHTPFAVHAAGEGDRAEVATQIVAPGVVDALEVLHVSAIVEADQRAPMGTAVLEGAEFAVFGARDDDGHSTNEGGTIIADVGEFVFQAEKAPYRTFKKAFLLQGEHVRVCVYPIGDTGETGRPDAVGWGVHGRPFAIHGSCDHHTRLRGQRKHWSPSPFQPGIRHTSGGEYVHRRYTGGEQC